MYAPFFHSFTKISTTMSKFKVPTVPNGATDDEKRAIYFDALSSLNLNDKTEKVNDLTYLSWANAWAEFKRAYPSATYQVIKNPQTGLPYFLDEKIGIMVFTQVTADDVTHEMWLPVLGSKNKAMKTQPYTYQVWDSYKKQYVEKTVQAATMFDINKTIMRCLVKNLAMFGLGLYIYAGEDIPEKNTTEEATATTVQMQKPVTRKKPAPDKYAGIKTALQSCNDNSALMSLYTQHKQEVEQNVEIKSLFTERKLQIQQAA